MFYSNSLAMVSLSMVFSVLSHNLAKSNQPDDKVPKNITWLLNTKFGTVLRFKSLQVILLHTKFIIMEYINCIDFHLFLENNVH